MQSHSCFGRLCHGTPRRAHPDCRDSPADGQGGGVSWLPVGAGRLFGPDGARWRRPATVAGARSGRTGIAQPGAVGLGGGSQLFGRAGGDDGADDVEPVARRDRAGPSGPGTVRAALPRGGAIDDSLAAPLSHGGWVVAWIVAIAIWLGHLRFGADA